MGTPNHYRFPIHSSVKVQPASFYSIHDPMIAAPL